MAGSMQQSNFAHLRAHDEQLVRLGLLAERDFAEDTGNCLSMLEGCHVLAREQVERLSRAILTNVFKSVLVRSEVVVRTAIDAPDASGSAALTKSMTATTA